MNKNDLHSRPASSIRKLLMVLVALVLATVLGVSSTRPVDSMLSSMNSFVPVGLLLLAFVKVAAIGYWYMELRLAPRALLSIFMIWIIAFGAITAILLVV